MRLFYYHADMVLEVEQLKEQTTLSASTGTVSVYVYEYSNPHNGAFSYVQSPLGLSTVRIFTEGGVVTLVDPSISEFRSTIGAQPAGSINRLDILGHGSRNQMIIEPGSSGHGLIWVPGVTDQIMFTDNAESFSGLLRDKLSSGATVDLKGCNTAREGPFFDNQHITRQVSIELPGVSAVGSRGFGLGNDLSNPFNRDQYIRFGGENHVFRIPRSYQNGVQK